MESSRVNFLYLDLLKLSWDFIEFLGRNRRLKSLLEPFLTVFLLT